VTDIPASDSRNPPLESAVLLSSVSKSYASEGGAVQVLAGVSLCLRGGNALCIMGPSGAGKTTLLKVAAGYLKPDAGDVALLGMPVYSLPIKERLALRRRISFMFQEDLLIDTLTIKENVSLPLFIRGVKGAELDERASRAISSVGLEGKEGRWPSEVSGGARRRASLARCLVSAPQAIFADEPTSNLDSKNAFMVADLLIALASSGLAVVMTTHDPLVARRFRLRADIRDGCLSADPGASADATNCLKMVPR